MPDINKLENNTNSELEKTINDLYEKLKNNRLNLEIKENWLKWLLPKKTLIKLNKEIPNFKEYIDALKKENIVVVMMWEEGLPKEFIDRRFCALVRFMKWISNKKFIIVNEQNNARVWWLLEEAWHLKNPKWNVKKWEKFTNYHKLVNYIKSELESAIFWNSVTEIIFNKKRNYEEILNEIIDIELLPHYDWNREDLLKIIFKEYNVNNLKELLDKIKNNN